MRLTLGAEERDQDDSHNPYAKLISPHDHHETDLRSYGVRSESARGEAWFGINGKGLPYVKLDSEWA